LTDSHLCSWRERPIFSGVGFCFLGTEFPKLTDFPSFLSNFFFESILKSFFFDTIFDGGRQIHDFRIVNAKNDKTYLLQKKEQTGFEPVTFGTADQGSATKLLFRL